ncbi:DMT family transporter [Pacificispira sp.]|uniref:DMT family transporter n=1 Tax=Pacificispira sp. TaxID=2888761 RepID=UPI003BAB745E
MAAGPDIAAPSARVTLGFLAAGLGFLLLPVSDAIAKAMGIGGVHPLQIGWGRWLAQVVYMLPLALCFYGRKALFPKAPLTQIGLGLSVAGATVLVFFGLRELPMPTVTATLFVAPLIVTAVSGLVLGERVGPWRWGAVAVGFVGMLLIVKPGTARFEIGSLYAVGAAICLVLYLLIARKNAGRNPPMVTMLWMGIVGAIGMTPLALPVFQAFTAEQWLHIAIMGAVLTLGHGLIVWAADRLEASAMAPMPYFEMVTATVLGYVVFNEFPALSVWLGCGLVIGGGLFVAWRETRR